MTQALALFLDAYRELNAKRLFWITLILSGLFIAGFATLGVDAAGLKFLKWHLEMPMASFVYREVFSYVVVGFWLTWAATVLALISTTGIFPDFIASGTIDLYLARPIARLRLFLIKYLTGLLFVLLQVLVFCAAAFLVLGLRAGEWRPSLFLAVPLVVALFSYLFSIGVLIGVSTRSTIAALLLVMVCWAVFWAVNRAETKLLEMVHIQQLEVQRREQLVRDDDEQIRQNQASHSLIKVLGLRRSSMQKQRDQDAAELEAMRSVGDKFRTAHRIFYGVKTVLPKTSDTTDMLDRWLFTDKELAAYYSGQSSQFTARAEQSGRPEQAGQFRSAFDSKLEAEREIRHRSVGWVVGTSLAFEAVIVAWAAWIFCRRDY